MNKDEKTLRDRFGHRNHFTVPEGYFEQLTQQVMERLPEEQPKVVRPMSITWHRYRAAIIAAACTVIAVFGVALFFQVDNANSAKPLVIAQDNYSSTHVSTLDQMADYTMIDSDDIYASLYDYNY